ncbi:interleukin-15 receptor subunit alpha [Vidua chalybeata]|uniref:interleukin-15 receptor subunit alpha n=1 Tax=Vidua chalybeata TaxID=81927 RepID=UPI0023A8931C|nr:interleukin-15 receptor subunit alpha [Vidua chalybeata]
MAPPLLQLLCGTAALLLLRAAADTARCSRPKAVANAHIDAGNRTELNSRLRYSCNPGYKRKAGTSSLIQCILWNGSEPRWTDPTLQCIRDPALSWETPGPESTTQRGEEQDWDWDWSCHSHGKATLPGYHRCQPEFQPLSSFQ